MRLPESRSLVMTPLRVFLLVVMPFEICSVAIMSFVDSLLLLKIPFEDYVVLEDERLLRGSR